MIRPAPRRLVAAAAGAMLLAGCATGGTTDTASGSGAAAARATSTRSAHPTSTRTPRPTATGTSRPTGGLPTCDLASLPAQARDTAELIVRGGPFPYPRNDGVVYQNRNRVLPQRARGTYREFTVRTPGAPTRGTRRIITDGNPTSGQPTTSPSAWYYTGDHYDSFCALTGTP